MSDSEDENYAKYGCPLDPLDEDNLPRKKAVTIQDQYAVDEYGRRRFHGAFTGGFSAGYFNSVGTRDGWQPQQFKSSRKKRVDEVIQRPEDFMDEEDTSEFGIAPTGIRVTKDYVDTNQRGTKRERARQINDGPIPGTPVLENLIKPVKDRIGVKLLKKMGWKPGQGVGPRITKKEKAKVKKQNEKVKVYTCYMPSQKKQDEDTSDSESSDDEYSEIKFAPDDYEPFRIKPKDNCFGIGYSGLDKRPVLSGHINLFEPQTFCLQEKNKKFSVTGQAFGVGAFEADDEDIYAREDMSHYDFELGPEKKSKSRWNQNKAITSSGYGCLEGFELAKNPLPRRKFFEPPNLPKDFKPIHVVRKSRFFPPIESPPRSNLQDVKKKYGGQDLNAEMRAAIIGEPSVSGKAQDKSSKEQSDKQVENSSTAAKIIARTLNLHGKEQVAERQKLEEQRRIASDAASSSWLDKLYSSSFIKGGIMGPGLNVEGSLQKLEEFKDSNENKSQENNKQAIDSTLESSNSTPVNSSVNLFLANPDKQRRFQQYLDFRKDGDTQKLDRIQPLSMSEWDRNQEKTEFEQAARLSDSSLQSSEKKSVSNISKPSIFSEPEGIANEMKEAAKMKMFGKLTRERKIWQPSSLVCKRFNVAEPSVGCVVETEKKKKFSIFDSLDFCSGVSKFQTSSILEKEVIYEPRNQSHGVEEKPLEEHMTEKEKNFEASYEKVFGRGVEEKKSEELESSTVETCRDSESGANSSSEGAKDKMQEKRDLFKAIFLSSSEDSDSEIEESVDSEVVKSVLIGMTPAGINVERNTSPPRGIFAKLDLDSLVAPSDQNQEKSETSAFKEEPEEASVTEVTCEEVLPPDVYGPLPPAGDQSTKNTENKVSSQSPKPVFRTVVASSISGDKNKVKGEWVERTKVKKSKKEKKKHKHKDKDKERYKRKKSKKEKRYKD